MSDFWEDMQGVFASDSSIDEHLQGKPLEGEQFTAVRELAEKNRKKNALRLPVEAGTRVRFVANLGSVLTYPDVPDPSHGGTVVKVRSANGDVTSDDGRVFVVWDDGKFRPIMAEHLRRAKSNKRRANSVRIVTSDLDGLAMIFAPSTSVTGGEELVHRSTQDLWSFKQDGSDFVIERLFDETGEPLKV